MTTAIEFPRHPEVTAALASGDAFREALATANEAMQAPVTVASEDGDIIVVLAASGRLENLWLDADVLRHRSTSELAEEILDLIRVAWDQVADNADNAVAAVRAAVEAIPDFADRAWPPLAQPFPPNSVAA